jgi:hypothetical protein
VHASRERPSKGASQYEDVTAEDVETAIMRAVGEMRAIS